MNESVRKLIDARIKRLKYRLEEINLHRADLVRQLADNEKDRADAQQELDQLQAELGPPA